MRTDALFYRVFQTLPQLLFDLIAPQAGEAVRYRFEAVELKETAFRLDGVLQPPSDQPDWPVVFVEVQFQLDPELYSRLFTEVFLYLRHHRPVHPWQAVVIYRTRALDPGGHRHYDLLLQSAQVTRVYLDEWAQPRQTLMQRLMGVLLVEPAQAVGEARALLGQLQKAQGIDTGVTAAIVNLVETILVYKLPTLSREEIQGMLEFPDVDLKRTRFYQDVFSEGEQVGQQKGQQQGRQEEGVALILRQLHLRCGELAPTVREQITRLSLSHLEALGEALLDFRRLADLERWLVAHARE
jgi:predicted transposase/invertase (TIGR01784 family)